MRAASDYLQSREDHRSTSPTVERQAPPQPTRILRVAPSSTQPPVRAGPAGKALVVGVMCFALWALLDAAVLLHSAQASRVSSRRSAVVAVLRPVARLSAWCGLDRPVAALDAVVRRPRPGVRAHLVKVPPTGGQQPSDVASSVGSPALRIPTGRDPLRVLVVGDSLAEGLGYSLVNRLAETGLARATVDARVSTGLARADYFDWPAQLSQDLGRLNPDIVVVMVGVNDSQSIVSGDTDERFGTPGWDGTYRQHIDQFLAQATAGRRHVVWVGLPLMKAPALSSQVQALDLLYGQGVAAASRGSAGAVYVDTRNLLADAHGHFATFLPDHSGRLEQVRQPDGVHLAPAGADRVSSAILDTMSAAWGPRLDP